MTQYLKSELDFNDPNFISALDDMSIWSAPFGLKLLSLVQYRKNIRALDIGFGAGFPLLELAMRLGPTCRVFGLDPWKTAFERTRFKMNYAGIHNVELTEGVAERMPFEDNFFNLIVSNNGLNNVQDLPKSLSECSRVSSPGSQLVFTFNTNKTFAKFYDVFRTALSDGGRKDLTTNVDEHINQKRKPVEEVTALLKKSHFQIVDLCEDEFDFKFSDATAMFRHFFMQIFIGGWKEIVPVPLRDTIFQNVEHQLNILAEQNGGLSMNVPFVTLNCKNVKD
jgi:arsenite methyltransferase